MYCPKCNALLPNDARFCIECGTAIVQPATGPTQRIETAPGERCPACQTINPTGATFCVHCGHSLSQPNQAAPAQSGAFGSFDTPQPLAPTPVEEHTRTERSLPWRFNTDSIATGIFMIGLAILFLTKFWWPGIIVVIGFSGAVSSFGRGREIDALQTIFWTMGIAVIALNNWWWPGFLILIGISAMFGSMNRKKC